jgi:AcrR family transcriptional regulator
MARERKFSKEELYETTKDTLLHYGYEGFTFGKAAARLKVSRGTIYKYFDNKEELITAYMLYEMEKFLVALKEIKEYQGFQAQFDFLLDIILQDNETHQVRGMVFNIPAINDNVKANLEQLKELHQDMYRYLQDFVNLGREEQVLKQTIPDSLILAFIFQTVDIPNHFHVPEEEWKTSIKETISHGMFTKN